MSRCFIETEMPKRKGDKAEKITFDSIKEAFRDRECYAYLNFPIFLDNFFGRREPDILLLDKELGVTVIEVKGINISNIVSIKGYEWTYKNFYTDKGNPSQQAQNQLFSLMDDIKKRSNIHSKLTTRVLIALPYITKTEWESRGFFKLKSNPHILFKEDLEDEETLVRKISNFYLYERSMNLEQKEWEELLELINGEKSIEEKKLQEVSPNYSFLYIASTEKELLDQEKLIREYLKRGVKVILLCPFEKKEKWFGHESYDEFKKSRFFQYISSIHTYQLDQPITILDGIGVDKNFETKWLDKFPKFNKGQYKAEHAPVISNLKIDAGAGSGKTTVMVQRVMFLLAMVPDLLLKDIVLITFTRQASQEMKYDLEKELLLRQRLTSQPKYLHYLEQLRDMNISTIDSFAKSLVQELGFVLGFGRDVKLRSYKVKRKEIISTILDKYVAGRTSEELGLDGFTYYEFTNIIEQFWDEIEKKGYNQKEIESFDWGNKEEEEDEKVGKLNELFHNIFTLCESEFNEIKIRENAITIGDLVRKISDINWKKPEVLAELPNQFKYLFVDEFQDSDNVQIELVSQINKVMKTKLFVVGDVKQSIYRFRGADYTAFDRLKENVGEEFVEEVLKINYRTSKTILEELDRYFTPWGERNLLTYGANHRLEGNQKATFRGVEEFNTIRYKNGEKDLKDKVILVVRETQKLIHNQQPEKKKIALLVRTNRQAKKAYDWLYENDIAVEMNIGGAFYKSEAVKDFHCLLGALLYPNDSKNILNALATPYFSTEILLADIIKLKGDNHAIIAYLRKNHELEEILDKHVEELRYRPVFAVIRQFLKRDIYQRLYSKKISLMSKEPTEQQREKLTFEIAKYKTNLDHLMNLLNNQFDSTSASLYSIYSWLGINISTNRNEDEPRVKAVDTDEIVEVVTVHKAKGLEYHTVIIPFTNQNYYFKRNEIIFDDKEKKIGWFIKQSKNNTKNEYQADLSNAYYYELNSSEKDEVIKEEARLLYVALTRVRERLFLFLPEKSEGASIEMWSNQLSIKKEEG